MQLVRKCACALFAAAVSAVFAEPQISVDNATFNGGSVKEGTAVKAVFKLTNTGTEPLHITNVRPGCGCTVVAYDSVIAPGKTGFIRPEVDTKGMKPGQTSRGVTVTSNAANTPTLHLIVSATIMHAVEISENYLVFTGTAPKTVTLTSPKKDLKVTSVVFTPQGHSGNTPQWAANTPINLTYKLTPQSNSTKNDLKEYRLEIMPYDMKGDVVGGMLQINTNNPEKKEIVVGGRME